MVPRKCWHGKEWIVLTWKRRVDTGGGVFFSWVDCFWFLRRRVDTRAWCVEESGRVKSRGRVNLCGFVKPVWFCLFCVGLSILCGFHYNLRGLTFVVVVLSLWGFWWVCVIRRESRLLSITWVVYLFSLCDLSCGFVKNSFLCLMIDCY